MDLYQIILGRRYMYTGSIMIGKKYGSADESETEEMKMTEEDILVNLHRFSVLL